MYGTEIREISPQRPRSSLTPGNRWACSTAKKVVCMSALIILLGMSEQRTSEVWMNV